MEKKIEAVKAAHVKTLVQKIQVIRNGSYRKCRSL